MQYFFDLLLALTIKEIKTRYRHTILGILWIFINPLLQMIVIGLVFSSIFTFDIKNYHLFLFIGLLSWNFFSVSLNKATPRIVWDRHLIQKSKFPKEVIPLSIILSHFFHFIASLGLLIIFILITKQWQMFNFNNILSQITGFILLFIFVSGISLFTSALNVFYRDIAFVVQSLTLIWFYFTPIIYPLNNIPNNIVPIFYLNPILSIFYLIQKPLINYRLPLIITISHIIIIIATAACGTLFFRKKQKCFADWL